MPRRRTLRPTNESGLRNDMRSEQKKRYKFDKGLHMI